VLLRLFALEGPSMLERLNGIFAFAIWDDRDRKLFLARDRLGVKPLYLARAGDVFAFSSELRSLLPLVGGAPLAPLERYLSFSSYYSAGELQALLTPELRAAIGGHDPLARHRAYLDAAAGPDELSRLLYLDHKAFLPCLNLTYTDKMSMAASVEVRVPLLDDELVKLAARIPSSLKLHGLRRKYVFKKSQERVLPRDIVWRRKAGFGAPVRAWLSGDLAPMIADLLSEETVSRRGLVDPGAVRRLIDDNASGRADTSLQLYALLTLELWHQTFVDRPWTFDRLAADSLTAA
jgi:asparagine synthase (glutamine-hydrolysing)